MPEVSPRRHGFGWGRAPQPTPPASESTSSTPAQPRGAAAPQNPPVAAQPPEPEPGRRPIPPIATEPSPTTTPSSSSPAARTEPATEPDSSRSTPWFGRPRRSRWLRDAEPAPPMEPSDSAAPPSAPSLTPPPATPASPPTPTAGVAPAPAATQPAEPGWVAEPDAGPIEESWWWPWDRGGTRRPDETELIHRLQVEEFRAIDWMLAGDMDPDNRQILDSYNRAAAATQRLMDEFRSRLGPFMWMDEDWPGERPGGPYAVPPTGNR
ncbi:MAG: hypothetical protein IMX01_00175 [Limnochordaceae bacterium]|nr:hypothetical protein [Limnochordaceae bacterium]